MKILIIGAKGMLGTDLIQEFKSDYEVAAWDKDKIDITSPEQVETLLTQLKPDVVINAAAYTAVDACESNRDICMDVNAKGPRNLATACNKLNAILVHYTSDYVFNGQSKQGYKEDAKHDPINVYGESKALSETYIFDKNKKNYLIRTSWMFGENGNNFVYAMLKLADEHDELTVVNDQFGRPTYSKDLAKQTRYLIENNLPFGIYHITNMSKDFGISWFDFANKIFKIKQKQVKVKPVDSIQFPRPATRPKNSVLLNTKLPSLRSWDDALTEFLKNIDTN